MKLNKIKAIFYRLSKPAFFNAAKIFDDVFWPGVDILVMGMFAQWLEKAQTNVPNLLLTILVCDVLWQAFIRANYAISVSVLEELWDRNLVNLFSTPLVLSEWMMGGALLGLIKVMAATIFGGALCWLLYATNIFAVGPILLFGVVSMYMFGLSIGFFSSSFVLYGGQKYQSAIWSMSWLFVPFCAVFYPLDTVPGWMRYVGMALPPTYFFEGLRSFLFSGVVPYKLFVTSFCLNVAYLVGMILLFRAAFEKSREFGLARLE